MKTVDLELELLTDLSVPENSRSLGGGRSLDFVPGRALWGAAATALFAGGMDQAEGLALFRSGALRILDAVPACPEGGRTFPTPRSWHEPKYGQGVVNLASDQARAAAGGRQHEAVAEGWRSAKGKRVTVERRYSLRTSVTASGRTAEGLLFGIDAIPEGTRLHARIAGDPAVVDRLLPFLTGELALGRSRSAELGRVRCRPASGPAHGLARDAGSTVRVHFLCCSRLALRDPMTGAPTFRPWAEAFGLPGSWRFVPEASFLRTVRYSPFNAKWMRPGIERLAIDRGSVLVFNGEGPVELDAVGEAVAAGVGAWRTEGLGEVAVQPRWLMEKNIQLPKAGEAEGVGPEGAEARAIAPAPRPDDELFGWANARATERSKAMEAYRWAVAEAKAFSRFRLNAAQWGVIHGLAREARHRTDPEAWLKRCLREFVSRGVSSLSRGWGATDRHERAGERLLALIEDPERPGDLVRRVEMLAGHGMRQTRGGDR